MFHSFNEIRKKKNHLVSKYLENQNQLKKDQLCIRNEDKVCSKLILGYFMKKQLLIGIYNLLNITKVRKDDLNLSKEIVALLTIERFKLKEIENKLNKKVRGHYLCAAATLENEEILIKSNNKYTLKS
jgi:ATP-dependent DNA helicase RecQ